ncbi:3-hydroxyacyl-CoA dehydrogenase [Rhodobacter sp. 140A]|nr:3-hydroxyacyl-CoA dehydrogenase [Rhodobacter sp. 140A]
MDRLVVIGAGIMGTRICRHFLRAGHRLALLDPSPEALAKAVGNLRAEGLAPVGAARLEALDPIWGAADLVIEAVPEDLGLKRAVIAELDRAFRPETLIASNTSGLRSADLAEGLRHPGRFLIAHFFNPADLVPAVELVPGPATRPETLERVAALLTASGKKPAVLKADVPGFIANRLQHAMLRECFHLLEQGVADAETIDRVTRYSLGVRLALIGPLLQRDLNGLDTHLSIARYLYPALDARQTPPEGLAEKVRAGHLGRKSGRGFYDWDSGRDAQLDAVERLLPEVIALAARADRTEDI